MSTHDVADAASDPAMRHRLLSCGQQTNIVEALEIMDEDGRILGPDQQGELVMRGPTEMDGYLDDEAATTEIKKFGWLHTGDIGRRDTDGYFYITDRKRDMIISGGFNVFPFEVESALIGTRRARLRRDRRARREMGRGGQGLRAAQARLERRRRADRFRQAQLGS